MLSPSAHAGCELIISLFTFRINIIYLLQAVLRRKASGRLPWGRRWETPRRDDSWPAVLRREGISSPCSYAGLRKYKDGGMGTGFDSSFVPACGMRRKVGYPGNVGKNYLLKK